MYRDKWLYHASFSPLWKERIVRHKGIIDEKMRTITFQEEENSDDNEQAFYNEFGYEPDEQKIETQNKTIQEIKSERTWASFYSEHKINGILELDDDILNDIGKVIYNF
jgi:fructosamine-3-kinase